MIGLEARRQEAIKKLWRTGHLIVQGDKIRARNRPYTYPYALHASSDGMKFCLKRGFGCFPYIWIEYLADHEPLGDNAYLYRENGEIKVFTDKHRMGGIKKEHELIERAIPMVLDGDTEEDLSRYFQIDEEQARVLRIRAEKWIEQEIS